MGVSKLPSYSERNVFDMIYCPCKRGWYSASQIVSALWKDAFFFFCVRNLWKTARAQFLSSRNCALHDTDACVPGTVYQLNISGQLHPPHLLNVQCFVTRNPGLSLPATLCTILSTCFGTKISPVWDKSFNIQFKDCAPAPLRKLRIYASKVCVFKIGTPRNTVCLSGDPGLVTSYSWR